MPNTNTSTNINNNGPASPMFWIVVGAVVLGGLVATAYLNGWFPDSLSAE